MHSDPQATEPTVEFQGRMSDGRTAASMPVRLRFLPAGLELAPDVGEQTVWPYASLSTAEPIRGNSTDVLVSSTQAPGATLFVEDATFAQALRASATQLSTGAMRWKYAKPGLSVAGFVAALVGVVYLFDLTPAHTVATWIPDAARVRMGQQVMQSMTRDKTVCHTDEGRAALDKLTSRLSTVSGAKEKFHVVVVDWDLLNAFATPGSQIVMTRELISDAKSPDEVAGVLAHEMGHGLELHPEAGLVRAIGLSAVVELMSGGGGGTLANAGALLAQLSYTRVAEREADAHAIRILKAAAISPKGLSDFFQRISKLEGDGDDKKADPKANGSKDDPAKNDPAKAKDDLAKGDGAKTDSANKDESAAKDSGFTKYLNTDLLRTHPASKDRAKLIAAQAPYDATPSLTSDEWRALRGICKNAKKPDKEKTATPK